MRLPPVVLFPSSAGMGGLEEHVIQLGRGLAARGVTVAAICLPRPDLDPLRTRLRDAGVIVHVLEERGSSSFSSVRRLVRLVNVLRGYPGCIVHLHYGGYGGGEFIQIAAGLARATAVVRTEHVPPVPPFPLPKRVLVHVRDQFLTAIVCVAEQNRAEHIRVLHRPAGKFVVIPNGIDVGRYVPAPPDPAVLRELGFDGGAPLVGTVARLVETRKRIDLFVAMAAEVLKSMPEARFVVVGDGGLRSNLEEQARRLGIADKVAFTGERADVAVLLTAMRVFIMPSSYEAGPLTVLEALAMERPVVATPVGIVPDVIRSGVSGGMLVPIDDPGQLTVATLRLLTDQELAGRLARAGRQRVITQFSIDGMVERTIQLYGTISSRRRPAYGWNETSTQ